MTQVIINDILPRTQAIAVGSQTLYSTDWTANVASDVRVFSRGSGVDADDQTQELNSSQFSVAFIGDERIVQVTLVTPSTAGDIVTIIRDTPADRLNLYNNTNFLPSMLNNDFGILTLVDQQAQLVNQIIGPRYNYSAVLNPDMSYPNSDLILPVLEANQFWAKNPDDNAIIALDISDITGGGTVTEIDTGLGLTGGPITGAGTISFAAMPANTFWGNITGSTALPTQVTTGYFVKTSEIGVTVEAWSASLDSFAAMITSANQIPYTTATDTWSVMAAAANSVLITSGASIPSLSTTLPSAVQTNITKLGIQSQALDMGSHQINNLTDPTNPQDAATRAYVLAQTTGAFLPLIGGTMSGAINMGNSQINAMADPSSAQDAVTLSYMNTQLALKLSLSGGTMTGAINMGSHYITNLLDPVNPQDSATKNYVDSVAAGLTIQPAVFAASTGALTVTYANGASGIGATLTNAGAFAVFALDGTSPTVGQRVLIKNQASTLQNGIYTVTNVGDAISVNWVLTRATDYDQPSEIQPGDLVIVNSGTANGGSSWLETASVSSIGVDPILFSQFTFSATAVLLKANNLSDVANTVSAFNNISPTTTKGDIIVDDGSNDVRLAVGVTDGQILRVKSAASTGLAYSTATYPDTTTVNRILFSSSTNVIGEISVSAGATMVTDASSVPQFLANPAATGKMYQSVNGQPPAWSTPTWPSVSGTAGKMIISDGTNNVYTTPTFPSVSPTAGKVMIGAGTNWVQSTPSFPNASATSGKIIKSDGTNWVASTETYAAPGTSGNVMTSDGTNWVSSAPSDQSPLTTKGDLFGFSTIDDRVPVASGNGKVLQVDSTAAVGLSYSTPTYPSASGAAGKIIRSDGTNNIYSTSTFADTYTASNLLYSNGANTVTGLATGNNGVLITSGTGVPSISSTLPSAVIANITGRLIATQIFTGTGGTYTPTSGMVSAIAYIQAAGGGSGGVAGTAGQGSASGGGGGGGFVAVLFTAAQIGASQTITIGAVGTAGSSGNNDGGTASNTTVGALATAIGGSGGKGSASSASNKTVLGGAGGGFTVGTGTILFGCSGGCGHPGQSLVTTGYNAMGGTSFMSPGQDSTRILGASDGVGIAGPDWGGGASGAITSNGTGYAGAAGGSGRVIFFEYS